MKKIRNVIAIFLVLALAILPMSVGAVEDNEPCPIIFVHGFMSSTIYEDPSDPNSRQVFPPNTDEIFEAVKELKDPLIKFAADKDWDSLSAAASEIGVRLFGDAINDVNGDTPNKSGVRFAYPSSGTINKNSFVRFTYDWRRDPVDVAADLNDYIDYILECSGAKKVSIECHSLGSVITTSYLSIYGNTKIKNVVFNAPALYGLTSNGELMSGDMTLDPQGVNKYLEYALRGTEYENLLNSIIDALTELGVMDAICDAGNYLLDKMLLEVAKGVVIPLFGNWLSIWSMIPDEYVEGAMKYVFDTVYGDSDVDRTVIKGRIERFNELVREKKTQTLLDLNDAANVYVITRYGFSSVPVSPSYDSASDGVVDVKNASFGATVAPFGQQLSDEYLDGKDMAYISPDKTVDASTCLFPEQTWFVKNIGHSVNSDALDVLIHRLLRTNRQETVDSLDGYSRFLKYDVATETITVDEGNEPARTFLTILKDVFNDIVKLFKKLFSFIAK